MINIDIKLTKTDDGVWTKFAGSKLLITHISSLKFQRKLARLQQPFKHKLDRGTLDPKEQRNILCEAMSGTLLRDWDDVVDSKGVKIDFSEEMASTVLKNQQDIRDFISDFAMNLDNFREEDFESLGNEPTE